MIQKYNGNRLLVATKVTRAEGRQTVPCARRPRPGSLLSQWRLSEVEWGLSVGWREGNTRKGHPRRKRPWGAL